MNDVSFHKAERGPTDSITGLPCCLDLQNIVFLFLFSLLFSMCVFNPRFAFCFCCLVSVFFSPLALPRGLTMNESMPYTPKEKGLYLVWRMDGGCRKKERGRKEDWGKGKEIKTDNFGSSLFLSCNEQLSHSLCLCLWFFESWIVQRLFRYLSWVFLIQSWYIGLSHIHKRHLLFTLPHVSHVLLDFLSPLCFRKV